MNKKNIRATLWDFDGVIVNSLPIMEKCWKNVNDNLDIGNIPFSEYKKYIGRPFMNILEIMKLSDNIAEEAKSLYFSCDARNHAPNLYDGIKETLIHVREKYKTALITSKDMATTQRWIKQLGLENIFDDIQTPDLLPKELGKPNPHYIIQSLKNLEIKPDEAIYFGDMDVDLEASMGAGVNFAYASWGYGSVTGLRDSAILKSPRDIKKYIENIEVNK